MEKEQVMNDMNFRSKCLSYGLDWSDFKIVGECLIVNSPKKGIYVILNKNYNTIGIHKVDEGNKHFTDEELVEGYSELYDYVDIDRGLSFPHPFEQFSLKQIMELSNRVFIHDTNHGNSFHMIIDEKIVDCSEYATILSYIKFLGEQINEYFFNYYQMMMMDFTYPDIYSYIRNLVNNINECIRLNMEKGRNVLPIDVLDYLGQDRRNLDKYEHLLYQIIELSLKDNALDLSSISEDLFNKEEVSKKAKKPE